jgi:hypothetical protein
VRVALQAGGEVRSRVPGMVLARQGRQMMGTLGAGEATLDVRAGGDVRLRSTDGAEHIEPAIGVGLEDLGEQISVQVAEALAGLGDQITEGVTRAEAWAQSGVGQAADQARRAAEQAAERARMRAERAERRWRRASGRREDPRRESVSNEERLRVLQMVESGKISPQQAAELLSALEGS